MSERPWFKCYPSDFLNGVADLSPNELAVYTVVLMRIYDEGGAILDEPERIARRCNMRRTSAAKAIEALIAGGKLHRIDGRLSNERAHKETTARQSSDKKFVKSRAKVDQNSTQVSHTSVSKVSEKHNKNNGCDAQTDTKKASTRAGTIFQKPDSEANASAPPAIPPGMIRDVSDFSRAVFGPGLEWLAERTDKPPGKLRSLVGKWLKAARQDHEAVWAAMVAADRHGVARPDEWITARFGENYGRNQDVITEAAREVLGQS